MFEDARSVPAGTLIETDVCIVGGGAAGITLARDSRESGLKVVLLESGNEKPEAETQELYAGRNVGRPYEMFSRSRFRYLGGTTNRWGGAWCDLPRPYDMEDRPGSSFSGWPMSLKDLEPWYRKAQPVLRLGPYAYELSDWGIHPNDVPDPFMGPHLACRVLQQAPTVRFGRHYAPDLKSAPDVTVYLNANALTFETTEDGKTVTGVNVGVLPDKRFSVKARCFVISSGGIETARLLLLSKTPDGESLGNAHDLVGRNFMLHLEYTGGELKLSDPNTDMDFQTGENGAKHRRAGKTHRFVSYIGLSDEYRRANNLPAIRYRFKYPRSPELDVLWRIYHRQSSKSELVNDLKRAVMKAPSLAIYIARRIYYGRNKPSKPLHSVPLKCTAEQLPNPNSRIRLGKDLDAFGLPRVEVDWQLSEDDRRGIVEANRVLASELERSGFGTLVSAVPEGEGEWPEDLRGDQHHMGTTRMHNDPRQGVVDENCRVHGVQNLYVASCAVFPTGGTFNPTLTILALALRLSSHIKENYT